MCLHYSQVKPSSTTSLHAILCTLYCIYCDYYLNRKNFKVAEKKLSVKRSWISCNPDPINIHKTALLISLQLNSISRSLPFHWK